VDFRRSPFIVQALQPDGNDRIQPLPVMFSSWPDITILSPYESTIQVKRGDFGMVGGRKVHAMEYSVFDTLKETECCRDSTEDGVRWVARLGACGANIKVWNIYSFLARLSMPKRLLPDVSSH
jgi:hypothetical protein